MLGLSSEQVIVLAKVSSHLSLTDFAGGTLALFGILNHCLSTGPIDSYQSSVNATYAVIPDSLEAQSSEIHECPASSSVPFEWNIMRVILLVVSLFGTSCVIADGILTPAVSVISAMSGTR